MATEFITSENEHWYPSAKKKDVYYPSVTTIIGACFPKGYGFQKYLANQESWEKSQEILKAAGTRGTNVHKGSELLEEGHMLSRASYTLEEWQMLEGFVKWHKTYHPQVQAIEFSAVSDKLKTGGTIDRIYMIDGVRTLLDLKTSSAIHDNYWAQTAAYVKLWEEIHPDMPIEQTAILRPTTRRKQGYEYCLHTREQIEEDFKIFKSVQALWCYLNPTAKPTILDVPTTLSLIENPNG
jgi:hypothetical protein